MVKAVYRPAKLAQYQGNPFIEALPPIMSARDVVEGLTGTVLFKPGDEFADGQERVHMAASLLNDFFQPLSSHIQLSEKLSVMIREGYVGRNIDDGSLNTHMQNGYERVMQGDLSVCRFTHVKSTATSTTLIGCSGSGKSTTLSRILATYPQVIYHEKYNFTQLTYLKIDCPHDGSLKSLCIQFFRGMDRALGTDYETKYARKRHAVETLLALMSQIANAHAIGVLVIDEIQHLDRKRSGGVDKMLNFFVTLVNVIGLPVVFVGTPKARPIFERDLRSGRRGAGFGALVWEPMKAPEGKRTEWRRFTDSLWRHQWLQKRDEVLSDEIRDCWYDLSQGVIDIVVKLFVLSQLRAIATRLERITPKLMKKVYEDELKPVHPMLAALRSGDPDRIAEFSDLLVPAIEKRLLEFSASNYTTKSKPEPPAISFADEPEARCVLNMLLAMKCDRERVTPLVRRIFDQKPELNAKEMIPIILGWYQTADESPKNPKRKAKRTPQKKWHTLDSDDLRFIHSQSEPDEMYANLKKHDLIFDVAHWIQQ